MGLIRKTLSVTSAVAVPGTFRGNQPGFIKYRSEAEEARREQTALLRQMSGPSQVQVTRTSRPERRKPSGESWCCPGCRNHGCDKAMKSYVHWTIAENCECAAHHPETEGSQ
jgi:hypothetical protein